LKGVIIVKRLFSILLLCFGAFLIGSKIAFAQAVTQCDAVLAPTIEQATNNYSRLQSYMFINAESEYEKLKSMTSSQRSAQASFMAFGGEYGESNSKEDFSLKVRTRLTREGFSFAESGGSSSYRIGVSDQQVLAWESCIKNGGLLFTALFAEQSGFVLKVNWKAPPGVGETTLELRIDGGTFEKNGTSTASLKYIGNQIQSYIIKPNKGIARVLIVGNVPGFSAEISVPSVKPDRDPWPHKLTASSTSTFSLDGVKLPLMGDDPYKYGSDILTDRWDGKARVPGKDGIGTAVWKFSNIARGIYDIYVIYASEVPRPLRLFINGELKTNVANESTGSYIVDRGNKRYAGKIRINNFDVELKLQSLNTYTAWPHFKELGLEYVSR
jgi:hypothetical protein